jgi:hypothetical protein
MKSFAYEERFRDIVTLEGVDQAVRKAYGITVEVAARTLANARNDGMSAAQVSATMRTAFDPLLNKYLGVLRRDGWHRFVNDRVLQDELESLLEDEAIAARIAAVLPAPPGRDADTWRQTIVDAVDVDDDWLEGACEEEMYGAFGIRFFSHYDFAIDASLPGTLVESNATSREGDVLKWAFTPDAFLLDDYVLRARSRLVYPARIALIATALVALLAGWWVVRRTARKNHQTTLRPS